MICSLWIIVSFKIFFYYFYIYLHVYTLFGTTSSPHHPPTLYLPTPASRKNLFGPLVLRLCWRENISADKKDRVFLLVWDKDSYTKRFLALFPYTCVLQTTLVHLFTTPWSPSHSGLCQFKIIIFAPLQWAHQPHSSFRFPSYLYSSPVCVLPLVCDPCPIILLHLF
jgi:hypothetical protein